MAGWLPRRGSRSFKRRPPCPLSPPPSLSRRRAPTPAAAEPPPRRPFAATAAARRLASGRGAAKGGRASKLDCARTQWPLVCPQILDKFIVDAKDHLERIKFPHEPLREAGARFLRARKYDAAAAMAMAEASHKWRDEAKLEDHATVPTEELLGCPVDELNAFYPNVYLPVLDSHFRPVYMERTGRIDVPALMCSTGQEGLLAWHKKQLVTTTPLKLANATKARTDGRVVNSSTTIMDMEGFTMGMLMGATKEYLGKITSMDSVSLAPAASAAVDRRLGSGVRASARCWPPPPRSSRQPSPCACLPVPPARCAGQLPGDARHHAAHQHAHHLFGGLGHHQGLHRPAHAGQGQGGRAPAPLLPASHAVAPRAVAPRAVAPRASFLPGRPFFLLDAARAYRATAAQATERVRA